MVVIWPLQLLDFILYFYRPCFIRWIYIASQDSVWWRYRWHPISRCSTRKFSLLWCLYEERWQEKTGSDLLCHLSEKILYSSWEGLSALQICVLVLSPRVWENYLVLSQVMITAKSSHGHFKELPSQVKKIEVNPSQAVKVSSHVRHRWLVRQKLGQNLHKNY